MFLEQYKLEVNPFASRQVRPRFQSSACRAAARKLERVLDHSLYCLFLSGPAGVGKSSLVERHFKDRAGHSICLIGSSIQTGDQLLGKVLRDAGLPAIDARGGELRNILEVYLRHQASKGLRVVLVADPLERLAEPVLKELEALMSLRYKNRPILSFILITRSEELVQQLAPTNAGPALTAHAHERLTGFTFEETVEYINACLQTVGYEHLYELFPEPILRDVYAYTQGVVGDLNALCFEGLNLLAEGPAEPSRVGLDSALIARAGERLSLRYDPSVWRDLEAALSPESIHQSDPGELKLQAAQLLVTSRGQVIAEIALNRPRMVLGRDLSCDISLDSSYVSRYQNLFMETVAGWMLIDLSSTNGCFVNGRRVTQHQLQDGDIIAVGHHQISFVGSKGRRPATRTDLPTNAPTPSATADTLISPRPIGKAESA
jgi:hypothetical protein